MRYLQVCFILQLIRHHKSPTRVGKWIKFLDKSDFNGYSSNGGFDCESIAFQNQFKVLNAVKFVENNHTG